MWFFVAHAIGRFPEGCRISFHRILPMLEGLIALPWLWLSCCRLDSGIIGITIAWIDVKQ
jgi:hypothetical protein